MLRRVEVAWPILNIDMQKRILDECLRPYLQDNQDAWALTNSGEYQLAKSPSPHSEKVFSAQTLLMQIHNK